MKYLIEFKTDLIRYALNLPPTATKNIWYQLKSVHSIPIITFNEHNAMVKLFEYLCLMVLFPITNSRLPLALPSTFYKYKTKQTIQYSTIPTKQFYCIVFIL